MTRPPAPEGARGLERPTTDGAAKRHDTRVADEPDIVRIPLGDSGHVAVVDAADYPLVAGYRWGVNRSHRGGRLYVSTNVGRRTVYLHRLIMDTPPGMDTDHRNGDGLDNTRANLRTATVSQNQGNRRKSPGTSSRHKGVTWAKGPGRWQASICVNGRRKFLGHYEDEDEAGRAYDRAALAAWGEFARLNFEQVSA